MSHYSLSTDHVYNPQHSLPIKESEPYQPINYYGKTKLRGDNYLQTLHPAHIILRTSWVYDTRGHNFVKTILRLCQEKTSLQVVDDQVGAPTAASSLANLIEKILDLAQDNLWQYFKEKKGTYHASDKDFISWADFAEKIISYTSKYTKTACKVKKIKSSQYKSKAKRPLNSRLNCKKAMDTLMFTP